jgi:phosphotransferase family enzyme
VKESQLGALSSIKSLWDNSGLDELRYVLLGTGVRRALRDMVDGLLQPGARTDRLLLRRVKFKPGRKLTLHYEAWIRSPSARTSRPVVAFFAAGRTEPDQVSSSLEHEAKARKVTGPFEALGSIDEGAGVRLLVSPLDPAYPQLLRLHDAVFLADRLPALLPGIGAVQYDVKPVRYRPGKRHVLRYATFGKNGSATLFAKLSREEDPTSALEVIPAVADAVDAIDPLLRVVRPLGTFAEENVILFPEVRGRPLSDLLRLNRSEAEPWLTRTGQALRAMHEANAAVGTARRNGSRRRRRDFRSEAAVAARAAAHFRTLLPTAASEMDEVLAALVEAHDALEDEPPTFTHGDFKAEHVWIHGRRLTVLDLTTASLGDPARDIGKFMADIRWWNASRERANADAAQRAFLEGYGSDVPDHRLARAGLYEILMLIEFIARRVPLFDRSWEARTSGLIGTASSLLEQAISYR